jgi:hypothetical protein
MQVSKKLKAILIIIFFTLIIILPVSIALIREYGYKDVPALHSSDSTTDGKDTGKR